MFFFALVAIVYPYEVLDCDESGQEETHSQNLTAIRSVRMPFERNEVAKYRQSVSDTVDLMVRRRVSPKNAAPCALWSQRASRALSSLARKPQRQMLGDAAPPDVPLPNLAT
jgi:hypothetical protein